MKSYLHVFMPLILAACSRDTGARLASENAQSILRYGDVAVDFNQFYNHGYMLHTFVHPRTDELFFVDFELPVPGISRVSRENGSYSERRKRAAGAFGNRSFVQATYVPARDSFIIGSDQAHEETFNLYEYSVKDQSFRQVTNFGYAIMSAVSRDGSSLYVIGRHEKFGTEMCLTRTDLVAGTVSEIFCDKQSEYKIYPYSPIVLSPDEEKVSVTLAVNGLRTRLNLAVMDLKDGSFDVLTDPTIARNAMNTVAWEGSQIFFTADGEIPASLRSVDVGARTTRTLFAGSGLAEAVYSPQKGRFLVSTTGSQGTPRLVVLEKDGSLVKEQSVEGYLNFWGGPALLSNGNFLGNVLGVKGPEAWEYDLGDDASSIVSLAYRPGFVERMAPACEAEDVRYPTFDKLPDGSQRMISAVLFKSKRKDLAKDEQAGIVYAHGGPSGQTSKEFISDIQILCHLGYTVLGANVRGSTGYGQEFEDLNNGDWGGGDALDYEYARRYLVQELKIPARRIGVMGGSYGGYMTNWLVTRPDNQFAFGISDYGMSDLFLSVNMSVIPHNTTSDMGEPDANHELYVERSPITHAANLAVPLFVSHGDQDVRVATEHSRIFVAKLRELGKDVTYLELPGEGHGYTALGSWLKYYGELFPFLQRVAPIPPRP